MKTSANKTESEVSKMKREALETNKRMNNSTLSEIDCCMRLTGDRPFEDMSNDDLDSIYAVAFKRWAYHLTRQGYIDALNKKRAELQNVSIFEDGSSKDDLLAEGYEGEI
jgi:hypothetical protein